MTVLQAPGIYTVTLAVNGTEHKQSLEVRKDPHTAGSEADIAEQLELLYAVKKDLEVGAEVVHEIEALRVQLRNLMRFSEDEEVKETAKTLEEKLIELEMNLVDLRQTGQGQDARPFRGQASGKAELPHQRSRRRRLPANGSGNRGSADPARSVARAKGELSTVSWPATWPSSMNSCKERVYPSSGGGKTFSSVS